MNEKLIKDITERLHKIEEQQSKDIELNVTIDEHYVAIKKKLKEMNKRINDFEKWKEKFMKGIGRIFSKLFRFRNKDKYKLSHLWNDYAFLIKEGSEKEATALLSFLNQEIENKKKINNLESLIKFIIQFIKFKQDMPHSTLHEKLKQLEVNK